jgi:hypothetical protein
MVNVRHIQGRRIGMEAGHREQRRRRGEAAVFECRGFWKFKDYGLTARDGAESGFSSITSVEEIRLCLK